MQAIFRSILLLVVLVGVFHTAAAQYSVFRASGTDCAGDESLFIFTGSECSSLNWTIYGGGTRIGPQNTTELRVRWDTPTSFAQVSMGYSCSSWDGSINSGTLYSSTYLITEKVTPSVSITSDRMEVCQGSGSIMFTATPVHAGGVPVYHWYIDGNNVYSGSSSQYNYNTSSLAVGSHTSHVVMMSSASCVTATNATSSPGNFTVTNKANYTVQVNGSGQVCSANNTNIYFYATVSNPPASGTLTYEWYVDGGAISTPSTNNSYTFPVVNNGNIISCKVYSTYWCVNSPVQSSNTIAVSFIQSTTPSVSIQLAKLNYCSGENMSLVSSITNASTYSWKLAGNQFSTSSSASLPVSTDVNAVNTFSPGDVVTLDVTGLSGTCLTSSSASASISSASFTIYAIPNAFAPSPTICSGTNPALSITTSNGVTGTTYSWTIVQNNATGATSGSGATISQVLSSANGVSSGTVSYNITPTSNYCIGPTYTATVTVKPMPVISNLPATATYCANATIGSVVSFTPTASITGTTFTWRNSISGSITGTTPTSGSGGISQTVYNSGTTAGSVVYSFTPTANGCSGTPKAFTVTVNPKPIINGLTNTSICSGKSASFALSSQVLSTTYTWTQSQTNATGSSNGAGSLINQALTNTNGLTNGTIVYTVTGTAGACTGTGAATVTVKPLPAFSANPPASSIWSSGTASYTPAFTIPSTFSWTSTPNPLVTGVPPSGSTPINNIITISGSTSTVTYAITPVSSTGGCAGATKNFVITITSNPTILATGAPGNRIALSDATLDAGSGYTSYVWTNSLGAQVGTAQTYLTSTPDLYTVKVSKTGITGLGTATKQINSEFSGLNENYVVTNTILVGNITSESGIVPLTVDELSQTVQYFDGLGRPTQTITPLGSPQKLDLVQPTVYDEFGREYRKYLPVSSGANGWPKSGLLDVAGNYTNNFYSNTSDKIADDTSPYAETVFEPSPLNRVLKQGSPGTTWKPVNPGGDIYSITDKTIKKRYLTNAANEVLLLKYDDATGLILDISALAYFDPNQLYANLTYDEHNNEVVEYSDKQGRVICKKVYVETIGKSRQYASTYYVYDDFGNLALVLPPEAIKVLIDFGD